MLLVFTLSIHFYKVKSHAGIIGNEMLMLLLEIQSQPTLTLLVPPSKQAELALKEIPSIASTGFAKAYEEHHIIQNYSYTA